MLIQSHWLDHSDAELVLGLVAPLGTDVDPVIQRLKVLLREFRYEAVEIRLSSLLPQLEGLSLDGRLQEEPEAERLRTYMNAGNRLRQELELNEILAMASVAQIAQGRSDEPPVQGRRAYILRSLKHPDEISLLRRVYGTGIFILGLYESEDRRHRYLVEQCGVPGDKARALMKRDQQEPEKWGQQTREAFHRSDVFFDLGAETWSEEIARFIDLIFGHPFSTPTRDEHSMFLAYGSSLRSADLSRQVGAVVARGDGQVLATGANDVPAPGGGLYWSDDPGQKRDHVLGQEYNAKLRSELIEETMGTLREEGMGDTGAEHWSRRALKKALGSVTEFGRAVHAEMDALLACARAGISPVGATLYTTTFPCHNCARHIIAAGIQRVVYVEPYPKSRAFDLHEDALHDSLFSSGTTVTDGRVTFQPFVGIGPRRYVDLFGLISPSGDTLERKTNSGERAEWDRETANLRNRITPMSYLQREETVVKMLVDFDVES